MCGICGFLGLNDEELLRRMCKVIAHRGPDDEGIYLHENVGLGHRRLSIIDLTKGHQPMFNEDGSIAVVFNGEIYNYLDIKRDLEKKGHVFNTSCDTEVLIHLYEEYRGNCVNYLNGMFAFAIWDNNRRELFLARDRLGIKPLYYAEINGKLLFASEIKAILQYNSYERQVNYKGIDKLLTFGFIPGEETLFKNIFKLLPGHTLTHRDGHFEIRRYWDYHPEINHKMRTEEIVEQIYELLKDAVKIRLMSEVPLGATLSGGIDSSTIVALMSQLSDKPVKTFTVGFGEEESDEFKYARLIAKQFNADHHEYIVSYPDMTELLPEILWYQEEPITCGALAPTYFLAKTIKPYVTVALIGEGADELFAGYKRFKFMSPLVRLLPNQIRHYGYLSLLNSYTKGQKELLYTEMMKSLVKTDSDPLSVYYDYFNDDDALTCALHFEVEHELPDFQLMRVDKMTMHCSVEARVPFLDHRLVELTAQIPSYLKLKKFNEKYILRQVVKDLLPETIRTRRKKGLTTPFISWFEKGFERMVRDVLSEKNLRKRGIFQRGYIDHLLRNNRHPIWKRKFMYQLLILVLIEYWFQIFIDEKLKIENS